MLPQETGIWRPKLRFFLAVSAFMALCFICGMEGAKAGSSSAPVTEQEMTQQLRFYAPIQELRAEFSQTKSLKEMGLELKSEGRLHFNKIGSAKAGVPSADIDWEITKPARIMVKIREKTITVESGQGSDMTTQTLKVGDIAGDQATKGLALLLPWLKLDAPVLFQTYVITKIGERSFHFVPRTPDTVFKSMDVDLAPDGHLMRMLMSEASGDQLEIRFKKPQILRSQKSK